jgi:arylsulfatase A-like enzyme
MVVCRRPPFQVLASKAMRCHSRYLLLWLVALLVLGGCGRGRPAGVSGSASRAGDSATVKVGRSADELRAAVNDANVVICVIDAVRADHVGCYGYPRDTTPNIDRLAPQAVVFDNHFPQSPMTRMSTVSLLTGLYPDTHLAYADRVIPPDMFSLEKALQGAGFRTGLFSANVYASPKTGVGLDFEVAKTTHSEFGATTGNPEEPPLGIGGPEGKDSAHWPGHVLDLFSDWLRDARRSRFLAYIHIMPPHTPYAAPKEMKALFADSDPPDARTGPFPFPGLEPKMEKQDRLPLDQWVNLYDANLRWADDAIGELVKTLSDAGVLDDTLLVVTSDHGEGFGEHGYLYHSFGVYDELLRAPFLIRFPKGDVVGRMSALTEAVDVTPTICDLLGVSYPGSVQGRSMVPLMTGEQDETHAFVFARALGETPAYLVRTKDHALMLYYGGARRCLFDLRKDPKELTNVLSEQPEEADRLLSAFREFANTQALKPLDFIDPGARAILPKPRPRAPISDETKRELRALGYIE